MKSFLPILVVLSLTACAGAQLEKQKKEIVDLQTQAGSLVAQLKDKSDEADALKTSKAELEAKVVELEGRAAAADGRVATLSKSNKDLSAAVGAGRDELSGKLKAVIAEKDELAKKLSEALKEKSTLERLKGISQSARDRVVRDLAKANEERDQLSARLASLDESRAKDEEARGAARVRAREEMGTTADAVLQEIQAGSARIEQDGAGFELSLSDALLFDEGSAKVRESGAAVLERAGRALKSLGEREVLVEGHSDNSVFKKGLLGGYEGHWELSAARATAVARWLHEHAGLDPARLSSAGYGEFRPAKPNDTPEGRAANRRVTLVVTPRTP